MMGKRFLLLAVLLAAASLAMGCGTMIRMTDNKYPLKDSYMVKILYENPKEPYEGIARLTISKFYWFPVVWPKTSGKISKELKSKAGHIGGEAIVIATEDFASISGLVIVFKQ